MKTLKVLILSNLFLCLFLVGCKNQQQIQPLTDFSQKITTSSSLKKIKAGATIDIPVTITNTGTQAWPINDFGDPKSRIVKLGYHWTLVGSKSSVLEGRGGALPSVLSPKQSATMPAKIIAPDKPGLYVLHLSMVQEYVAWFDDKGGKPLNISIKVTPK